jgi:hypothetical protein
MTNRFVIIPIRRKLDKSDPSRTAVPNLKEAASRIRDASAKSGRQLSRSSAHKANRPSS